MRTVTVPFFISHQGCPHTCVFCDQRIISGASGALPGGAEILAKVRQWSASAGDRKVEVAFFGGSFTSLKLELQAELLLPLQPLLSSGEIASIRLSTRPDCIDDYQIEWLKSLGVGIVELGIQSMDENVLAASGRGHTSAHSEAAIKCIRRHGLQVGAQLMPGLPGDTGRSSLRSLNQVIYAGTDFIRIYPTVVLRGTGLAVLYGAGKYSPLSLSQGVEICKVLLHRAIVAGLPVARIGLQADEGLNENSVLAGCWHPALGQIVASALYGDLIGRFTHPGESVAIGCHPSRVSDVVGHKRTNMNSLAERDVKAQVYQDSTLQEHEVIIRSDNKSDKYSLLNDLNYQTQEV